MIDCVTPDWPAPDNVRAATTTRAGGVSEPPFDSMNVSTRTGDEASAVAENRRRLADALNLPGEPLWLKQVHGNRVVTPREAGDADPEADAARADGPGDVCALQTADCLPLLLCDRTGTWVAALHCGWRGLAGGIIPAVVPELPGNGADTLAWMGPAIGPEAFEVGEEVREAFLDHHRATPAAFEQTPGADTWHADMYQIARHQLNEQGITQVHGGGWCTVTDKSRFYSFRRDGDTGRMATLIWLTE